MTTPLPTLVLLHGLARSRAMMLHVALDARARGWRVLNLGYASRRADVGAHARWLARTVDRRLGRDEPLAFVTHSLGGIVLRAAVADGLIAAERVHAAVMLGPPNQGSELADWIWARPRLRAVARRVMGPAGAQLRTTGDDAVAARLPAVDFPVGVIAGARTANPASRGIFGGPNDGKVSVRRAGVEGMRGLLVVPHTHTFMPNAPRVRQAIFAFLETGRFPS
jgi:triacylglycerol lipase